MESREHRFAFQFDHVCKMSPIADVCLQGSTYSPACLFASACAICGSATSRCFFFQKQKICHAFCFHSALRSSSTSSLCVVCKLSIQLCTVNILVLCGCMCVCMCVCVCVCMRLEQSLQTCALFKYFNYHYFLSCACLHVLYKCFIIIYY